MPDEPSKLEVKQNISTTVIGTSRRNCKIEVNGGNAMFSLKIGQMQRENGSIQRESEHYLYMDELDVLIDGLTEFQRLQLKSKIVPPNERAV
jgi:hypothetical protein